MGWGRREMGLREGGWFGDGDGLGREMGLGKETG